MSECVHSNVSNNKKWNKINDLTHFFPVSKVSACLSSQLAFKSASFAYEVHDVSYRPLIFSHAGFFVLHDSLGNEWS